MELHRTKEGFALYKEKTQIGFCTLTPAPKGAAIAALCIQPQWRRKGYGSYFLKEILRSFAGYDREQATVFTAPVKCPECGSWHTRPSSGLFFSSNKYIYKEIWKTLDEKMNNTEKQ